MWPAILLMLCGFVTQLDRITYYDLLEHNSFYDAQGRLVLQQWLAWDWSHSDAAYRCQWWVLDKGHSLPVKTLDGWMIVLDGKRIVCKHIRTTKTEYDPELEARQFLAKELRRVPRAKGLGILDHGVK